MEDQISIYSDIVSRIRSDYPVEEFQEYDEKTYGVLGDYVCRYIYINGLAKYEEILSKLAGKPVRDIPENSTEQIKWVKQLLSSTKEEKHGAILQEMQYWIWKNL